MPEEYKRTCHDELEWAEVEQLHAATIEISKNCFEYKKLCVSLLGVGAALLIKFSDNPASHLSFVIALVLCLGFWLADSTAFYYQRSVRNVMSVKFNSIAERNNVGEYKRSLGKPSVRSSLFNGSMTLYYSLVLVILSGWFWYGLGC